MHIVEKMNASEMKRKFRLLRKFNLKDAYQTLSTVIEENGAAFYAYLPGSKEAWIELAGERINPESEEDGIYRFSLPSKNNLKSVMICYSDGSGYIDRKHNPYFYEPPISKEDVDSYISGENSRAYEFMGSHFLKYPECEGAMFTVYAPNAVCASVIGNFNHWQSGSHPMKNMEDSGIWSIFIPDIHEGEIYKYAIKTRSGETLEKSDPYAFKTELRPRTGSVTNAGKFKWTDRDWMKKRSTWNFEKEPIVVYEMHLSSWLREDESLYASYLDIENRLIPYLRENKFNFVEFLPVMEHPLDDSWGYQVVNYYAPTSRHGNPEGFKHLINALHRNNIGVYLDWVPAHFPMDSYGLGLYDGTHLYEYENPKRGIQPDWGTYVFDVGRRHVINFLVSNAVFWIKEFHCDGLRIDAVSSMLYLDYSRNDGEWEPNIYGGHENLESIAFFRELNSHMHRSFPGVVLIAEESTSWPGVTSKVESGGLGFDMKWNMGWMHDTLEYFSYDPVHRKYHQDRITFSFWYSFSEKFILPFSHDEVVYGKGSIFQKMPGDEWQKYANVRLLYSYMFSFPGKKMIFMGDEFATGSEWNFSNGLINNTVLNHSMLGIREVVKDLSEIYRTNDFLARGDFNGGAFQWIDYSDRESSIFSFVRRDQHSDHFLFFIFNCTPVIRRGYRFGVPRAGEWKELFNSDSQYYGGSGVGNEGKAISEQRWWHNLENSIEITLPPLGCLIFEWRPQDEI